MTKYYVACIAIDGVSHFVSNWLISGMGERAQMSLSISSDPRKAHATESLALAESVLKGANAVYGNKGFFAIRSFEE